MWLMNPFTVGLVVALAIGAQAQTLAAPNDPAASQPASPLSSGARWPISPPEVLNGFDDPFGYAPGHRGVDLAAAPGVPVVTSLPGRVTVAGMVAGRSIVVVQHDGEVRTTYLPVEPLVTVGQRVSSGDILGTVLLSAHCPTISCMHWGARLGEHYIDPLSLFASAGPVVLLPEQP